MDKIKNNDIKEQRLKIIELLLSTNRKGVENLIDFLDKSNYFNCYGSFKHHVYNGGLAKHSLEVYENALKHNKNCDINSIIISSILHDVCKVQNIFPEETINYFAFGHGSKSVKILEDYVGFKLTDEERRAIRFHMGSKSRISSDEEREEYNKACNEELWELIHIGDCLSCGNYPNNMHSVVKNIIKVFKL